MSVIAPASRAETAATPGPSLDDLIAARDAGSRIVNGYAATRGQWPSMVAIFAHNRAGQDINFCGGTVIGRDWILTAAHCAAAMRGAAANAQFFVREGVVDLNDPAHRDLAVSDIVVNEDYQPDKTLNDVALLRLAAPLDSPRQKLVGRSKMPEVQVDKRLSTVIGYGRTIEKGRSSSQLLQVELPIVGHDACAKVYQQIFDDNRITAANLCAGYEDGQKDSCNGDSGGPLFAPDANGEQLQVGVVSWGIGCARARLPGVYAAVGTFEDWIRAHVADAVFVDKPSGDGPDPALRPLQQPDSVATRPGGLAQVTLDIVEGDRLKIGTSARLRLTSSIGGAVVIFGVNPDRSYYQLYPSRNFPAPGPDPDVARIEAGRTLEIPSPRQRDARHVFVVAPPTGLNALIAVVVPSNTRVDEIVRRNARVGSVRNLNLVIDQIAAAEPPPKAPQRPNEQTDRAVAIKTFEIVP